VSRACHAFFADCWMEFNGGDMSALSFRLLAPLGAAAVLASCASSPQLPPGVKPGEFARLTCEGGKTFAVRMAEDGKSARVRALHGASELTLQADGAYASEDYKLALPAGSAATLWHKGKVEADKCKV
jgi:hypothetical protein